MGGGPQLRQRGFPNRASGPDIDRLGERHSKMREATRSSWARSCSRSLPKRCPRRAIGRDWDGFLRLAASVRHGWYPATEALDHFGSAARGDPVYETGNALGKLLRTLWFSMSRMRHALAWATVTVMILSEKEP
jgi:hypothetical protein